MAAVLVGNVPSLGDAGFENETVIGYVQRVGGYIARIAAELASAKTAKDGKIIIALTAALRRAIEVKEHYDFRIKYADLIDVWILRLPLPALALGEHNTEDILRTHLAACDAAQELVEPCGNDAYAISIIRAYAASELDELLRSCM
jgi:hypothetical protein